MDQLNRTLKNDNHDMALDEKLEIIGTCFNKTVDSVIMQVPDLSELYAFKKCVRKFARLKMRSVAYYHGTLHANEDYLFKNMKLMRPFMPVEAAANLSTERSDQSNN